MAERLRALAAYNTTPETAVYPSLLAEAGLDVLECPVCENRGYVPFKNEDGAWIARECKCMPERRAIRRLKRSGLYDAVKRYTFGAYETPDSKRENIKRLAEQFAAADTGWFFIAGQSGSGKSHICTAICAELMKRNNLQYILWRDTTAKLKAAVTDAEEYEAGISPLKKVPVLYIDDFLKGKVTDADLNLAFEILNARYNDSRKRTIISTERSIYEIMALDEALGGRIYERSKGFCIEAPNENWRTA